MSVIDELQRELIRGVVDGRREALEEAPVLTQVAGLQSPNYAAMKKPIYVGPMPYPILGKTGIKPDGEVEYVAVNSNIPHWVEKAMRIYNKGVDWAKKFVYTRAKLTTEHELAHAQSSRVAKGEELNEDAVAVMESVTTYAKHKTAKKLGKHTKASVIKASNPYPRAWRLGEAADWAPYSSPSGEGYKAFMKDAGNEPFYKPLWRLGKAVVKAGLAKGLEKGRIYMSGTGVPKYVPQTP